MMPSDTAAGTLLENDATSPSKKVALLSILKKEKKNLRVPVSLLPQADERVRRQELCLCEPSPN